MLIKAKTPERKTYLVSLSVHIRRNRGGTLSYGYLKKKKEYCVFKDTNNK